jgi:hypothetical protein
MASARVFRHAKLRTSGYKKKKETKRKRWHKSLTRERKKRDRAWPSSTTPTTRKKEGGKKPFHGAQRRRQDAAYLDYSHNKKKSGKKNLAIECKSRDRARPTWTTPTTTLPHMNSRCAFYSAPHHPTGRDIQAPPPPRLKRSHWPPAAVCLYICN